MVRNAPCSTAICMMLMRPERRGLGGEVAQHVVGRRRVGEQVLVERPGQGEEFVVHRREPSARD